MYRIRDDILESIEGTTIEITTISCDESERIRKKIEYLYCKEDYCTDYMWENLNEYHCFSYNRAWHLIKSFIKEKQAILFFNKTEEKIMFEIHSGDDLDFILSETSGFEFYVTDTKCSYLLCFNHHDILYGCGIAMAWVEKEAKDI